MPAFDDLLISIEWNKYVNGSTVFPKLPVYLRIYHERWERNQHIRDAVQSSKTEHQILEQVNNANTILPSNGRAHALLEIEDTGEVVFARNDGDDGDEAITADSEPRFSDWARVVAPTPMLQPHYVVVQPPHQLNPPIVGGLLIGLSDELPIAPANKKRGQRGKDSIAWKKNMCSLRCISWNKRLNLPWPYWKCWRI